MSNHFERCRTISDVERYQMSNDFIFTNRIEFTDLERSRTVSNDLELSRTISNDLKHSQDSNDVKIEFRTSELKCNRVLDGVVISQKTICITVD
eukprot:154818-Amorphochlora_amoeboformis.AAC.1